MCACSPAAALRVWQSGTSAASRSACPPSICIRSARAVARSFASMPAGRFASGPRARARIQARLVTAAELPGGLVLDRDAAAAALAGIDPAAVVDVVNAEMLRALRVVSVERGHDPRDFALVAFGGAGPLHACVLAEELGIGVVLVPESAGVLSALGLVAGDERRDRVVSHVRPLAEVSGLPAEGEADLRYRGQSFELTVPLQADLAGAFHRAHAERYGYAEQKREIELVAVRTADVIPGPDVDFRATRSYKATGPELVELPGATCWVPDGWSGETNSDGTLVLSR